MSADTVICAIDPTKECDCASKPFAIDMYKHVIEALQEKYEMSEARVQSQNTKRVINIHVR